ncbi:MAG TPA: hypothetical protein VFD58_29370 [Blastocatellia bacterium]|nr:hypothetical protein [Blastocatellia bacterium]
MNIVLAHGIFGFRRIGWIEYFNGVKRHLEGRFPVRVLVTEVSPDQGIEVRGPDLGRQIIAALSDGTLGPGQKTHIIAHSRGGLDARFILSTNPDNIADRITSLTTIGTPHQGSPVADLIIRAADGGDLTIPERLTATVLRQTIDALGISLDGLRDLTTARTAQFNNDLPDNSGVHYFSIAGRGRDGLLPASGVLLLAYRHVKGIDGDNDGLVSVRSASRGQAEIWPVDHADEVGHDLDFGPLAQPPFFDYLAEYRKIVGKLSGL